MGQDQNDTKNQSANATKSEETSPIDGITIEFWAATNAALVQGSNLEDLLRGAGVDMARWSKASAEWEARMSRDATFVISQIYGNAFQAASKGRFAEYAREASAARAENRDLRMEPPISMEQYFEYLHEQSLACAQGKDAVETLKSFGLSIVDWCDLSSYMGYRIQRGQFEKGEILSQISDKARKKAEAKYPGVKSDVDVTF